MYSGEVSEAVGPDHDLVYFEKVRQALQEKQEQRETANGVALTEKLQTEIRQLEAQVFIHSFIHPLILLHYSYSYLHSSALLRSLHSSSLSYSLLRFPDFECHHPLSPTLTLIFIPPQNGNSDNNNKPYQNHHDPHSSIFKSKRNLPDSSKSLFSNHHKNNHKNK